MVKGLCVITEISLQNIKRWKWRLCSIAVLVTLAFSLYILYAGFIETTRSSSERELSSLQLPYDLMILAEPGERLLGEPEWPESPRVFDAQGKRLGVVMVEHYERTTQVTVDSAAGSFNLLGLPIDSDIYRPEELRLQGRWLQNQGEIVLPLGIAERAGISVGDVFSLSSWDTHPWQNGLRHKTFIVVGIYNAYDLRPALVAIDDANALTIIGEPNSCLFRYRRNQKVSDGLDTTLKGFLEWIRPAYPQATFIYRDTPQLLGEKLLVRIYQPGENLLWLILLLVCIGVLTIAVMTYLERRKEFAALKTVGISARQMILLFVLEYTFAEILGLVAAGALLLALSAQIDWLGALDGGTLFRIVAVAGVSTIAAVVIGVFYPVTTATKATINQLLYARRIPFFSHRIDHMENPSSFLVYRERRENLRLLKLPHLAEVPGLLLLKQCGDTVKKGEMVATEERFFGFAFREWTAFCDGTITVLESNGVVGIQPADEQAPFYPYSAHLLEAEQNRLRARRRGIIAAGSAVTRSEEHAKSHWVEDEAGDIEIIDYAAIARTEQQRMATQSTQARTRGQGQTLWRRLRPILGIIICGAAYYALYQWAAYQGSLVDTTAYYSGVVVLTDLQSDVTARSNLQQRSVIEVRNRLAGRIEEVMVRDGEMVEENQVLFRLENHSARIALDQALMELAQAQLAFDTLSARVEAGAADLQEQYLQALRQQITSAGVDAERANLRITAASRGVITAVHASEGETLAVDSPILGFYNVDHEDPQERQIKLMHAKIEVDAAARALEQLEIRAAYGGVVTDLNISAGQDVERGDSVVAIAAALEELDEKERMVIRQAEIELATLQRDLEHLELKTPSTGWLSQFKLRVGDGVSAGEVLGQISDDSSIKMYVNVPQSQIGDIIRGTKAEVRDFAGAIYHGEVSDIAESGITDARTRAVTFAVEIRVHGESLRPGIRVEVMFSSFHAVQAHIGPFSATTEPIEVIEMEAPVEGEIVAVQVENGQRLYADQVLAALSNEALMLAHRAAEARVNTLRQKEHLAPAVANVAQVVVVKGEQVHAGQLLAILQNEGLQAEYFLAKQAYEELLSYRHGGETLRSAVEGTLRRVYVRPGDEVHPGQLLAELSNPTLEYAAEHASVALLKLEAAYRSSERNPESGALAAAKVTLEKAQLNLEQRERDVESLTIRAEQAGTVRLARVVRPGEDVTALQLLSTLRSEDWLDMMVHIDEMELANLVQGLPVDIFVDAFPDEIFRGAVEEIDPVGLILESQVIYPVTVSVQSDPRLRAGMTASLRIVLNEVHNVLAVPIEFVFRSMPSGNSEAVEVVNLLRNGRLATTVVQTGLRNGEMVEIINGVREGDILFRIREDP